MLFSTLSAMPFLLDVRFASRAGWQLPQLAALPGAVSSLRLAPFAYLPPPSSSSSTISSATSSFESTAMSDVLCNDSAEALAKALAEATCMADAFCCFAASNLSTMKQ